MSIYMLVKKELFGMLSSGKKAFVFTVSNGVMSFAATNYGCCITGIFLPNGTNGFDDVVLGYSTLDGYIHNAPHFGSIIGRYAGRIRNAAFELDGTTYHLTKNANGKDCLHGGYPSYDKQVWDAETFLHADKAGITFSRVSPDGEQGFPGEVRITVAYILTKNNTLILEYHAATTKTTPINLTNHTYFNLNTPNIKPDKTYGTVLNHTLKINSNYYVETDAALMPTGNFVPVEGSPFDFRTDKPLNQDFDVLENGYDGTWLLPSAKAAELQKEEPRFAAVLKEPQTKRELHVYSTQPALTVYTANFLNDEKGKNGDVYNRQSAVCMETQHIPDSPNHREFPPVFITPDATYRHETRWVFKL